MDFEKNITWIQFGEKIGFLIAYFVFTTALYFLLTILKKIPISWSYIHVAAITLTITLVGIITKKILE